jgi:hypothetical protein
MESEKCQITGEMEPQVSIISDVHLIVVIWKK